MKERKRDGSRNMIRHDTIHYAAIDKTYHTILYYTKRKQPPKQNKHSHPSEHEFEFEQTEREGGRASGKFLISLSLSFSFSFSFRASQPAS